MIKENILKIRNRIKEASFRINKDPAGIIIVAVTKNRAASQIEEAIACGIADIGENRIQEAVSKYSSVLSTPYSVPKWHMVGHLQTNKVKDAVRIFDLIQSVDSVGLTKEIDKEAAKINKIQEILLEVKTSPEATKFGLKPEEAIEVIKEIAEFKNIKINGLMTIAPLVDDPQKTRPYFRLLRELKDKINESQVASRKLQVLSMGMSDDFEVAIEEGSNMVRIGRAIFSRQ
ncbi:MAG: YggS family pyridoxal phosphate enzyme [Omnitrophica WOR_2 bacterium RBG_13_41_10]|nr:MAG: YggS family pyridoxal phosphate enzyme [Omnitrophica WOR_2 bacterium RBG_13_41_10]